MKDEALKLRYLCVDVEGSHLKMWRLSRTATFSRAHIKTCRLVAGMHRQTLLNLLPASKKVEILGTILVNEMYCVPPYADECSAERPFKGDKKLRIIEVLLSNTIKHCYKAINM